MVTPDKREEDLKVLYSQEALAKRTKEIADKINKDFKDADSLVAIGVLCGSMLFLADLVKHLKMPVQLEFIRLSSYGNKQESSGKIKPVDLTLPSLEDKNVLIVEDIIDTGLTATFLIDYIKFQHKAKCIKFATLLDKKCARQHEVPIDYIGFEVDDKFVVGYGLDYLGYYRNLPYIGYFPGEKCSQ